MKLTRLPIASVIAGVIAMGVVGTVLVYLGLRTKPVTIAELKFPVLVIRQNASALTISSSAIDLQTSKMFSNDPPQDGNVVIDSDFNLFTQQHTQCEQGEMGMLFRTFVRPGKPLSYKFDFKRWRNSVLKVALEQLEHCAWPGGETSDLDRRRKEIAEQTTMDGVIQVLQSNSP